MKKKTTEQRKKEYQKYKEELAESKLKTLKDYQCKHCLRNGAEGMVGALALKQEAIKWIKKDIVDRIRIKMPDIYNMAFGSTPVSETAQN